VKKEKVEIPEFTLKLLDKLLEEENKSMKQIGEKWEREDFLFYLLLKHSSEKK